MMVEVIEWGERPSLWTKARTQAPVGVKFLGEMFAMQDWADKAIVVLDWQPEELAQSEHKHDAIVRVSVYKRYDGKLLTLEQNFDVTDLFSANQISQKELGWITEDFRKKLDYEIARVD